MRIQNSEACHVSRGQKPEARSRKLSSVSRLLSSRRCAALVRRSVREGGFTLIELLVVIAIIAILTALTVGLAKYSTTRSTESRMRAEIKSLEVALEAYKLDKGTFPMAVGVPRGNLNSARANSKLLYQALSGSSAGTGLTPDPGNRSYYSSFKLSKDGDLRLDSGDNKYYIVDPIGTPYNYISGDATIQSNRVSFDLWTFGLDGQNDTPDDIGNWKF